MAAPRLALYRERITLLCRWAYATLSILSWNTEGWGIEVRTDRITIAEQPTLPRSTDVFYALCKFNSDRCEGYLTGVADILLAMGNSHIVGGICNRPIFARCSNSGWKDIPTTCGMTWPLVLRQPFANCGRAHNGIGKPRDFSS